MKVVVGSVVGFFYDTFGSGGIVGLRDFRVTGGVVRVIVERAEVAALGLSPFVRGLWVDSLVGSVVVTVEVDSETFRVVDSEWDFSSSDGSVRPSSPVNG